MLTKRTLNLGAALSAALLGLLWAASSSLAAENAPTAAALHENPAAVRGKQIAIEADNRASGFVDSRASLSMILRDKKGRERTRAMRVKTMERENDGDWSLTIFDNPADVKGTALLTYSHGLQADDQWLYLPALKRVKRISSRNKSGPFMGSEIAFEDLSSFELEKYRYRFLREANCGELRCYVSEWIPAYPHSGYSRTEVWHDTGHYRTQRVEFYDRSGKHLKTLTLRDYELYKERFWRAHQWRVSNHKTGRSTELTFQKIELGVGLNPRDFDKNALKSAR
ncbi:MAG: outer membrane lipoprotein-sorting protein [Gammaproteobacteria bacterium]|nr:outer membrane lipoprotein-sorting protein [Gammaproteobacteria bacterium]